MPTEVSDDTKYVNGISTYILHITGFLINRQKAVMNITDIKPFFDVKVPKEMLLSMFKTKLVKILSNILNSISRFGIETISAFLLQEYHTEKKLYIHDDLNCQYYYRKVARKEKLPLLSWAVLSDYLYEHIQEEPYLYQIPEPGERFEYIVVENNSSQKVRDKMEYLESSETLLKALKRLKGDNGADKNGVDGNEANRNGVNKDRVGGDEANEDEISKKRDTLAQKSAEKWVKGYIKNLHEVKCLGNDAYWSFFLSTLDKQEESIHIKLMPLLAEISQDDIGSREKMYKFVTKASKHKSKAMTLEKYMLYIQENEYEILANFLHMVQSGWLRNHMLLSIIEVTGIIAELCSQLSQYIGFKPSEIHLPIAEKNIQEFRKIIADQEKMTDIAIDEY
ncbi:15833_t:CDS:2 [Cetraspora pellucida]|uniref:15833_t:CDS:1 n=1 Tax=Cetraspora pellucida TaxID=1433469 RepID=A0A9N8VGQ5_9GLOM|nr:15833_t:CDS:2 [Cetraspora pellucida]